MLSEDDDRPRVPKPRRQGPKHTSPNAFLREVRGEMRRVVWPVRADVVNYSAIVLLALTVLIALVFILDFAFAKSVLLMFDT